MQNYAVIKRRTEATSLQRLHTITAVYRTTFVRYNRYTYPYVQVRSYRSGRGQNRVTQRVKPAKHLLSSIRTRRQRRRRHIESDRPAIVGSLSLSSSSRSQVCRVHGRPRTLVIYSYCTQNQTVSYRSIFFSRIYFIHDRSHLNYIYIDYISCEHQRFFCAHPSTTNTNVRGKNVVGTRQFRGAPPVLVRLCVRRFRGKYPTALPTILDPVTRKAFSVRRGHRLLCTNKKAFRFDFFLHGSRIPLSGFERRPNGRQGRSTLVWEENPVVSEQQRRRVRLGLVCTIRFNNGNEIDSNWIFYMFTQSVFLTELATSSPIIVLRYVVDQITYF